jgi:beta-lactamase class A
MSTKTLAASLAVLLLAAAHPASPLAAEHEDTILVGKMHELFRSFGGTAGVYVRHLPTGRTAAIRGDEIFPTASLVKVPILVGLFARIERGELGYHQILRYRVAERNPTGGILNAFKDDETIDPALLATFMIAFSDNDASLWCQELAGGGAAINRWLEANGFAATRVNSRTPGREPDRARYGWGQSTPREMAQLFVRIHQRRAVSPAADDEMVRVLSRNYWDGNALAAIPPTVHAMSKGGAVAASRSEAVLVDAPSGSYVFCVMTRDQRDREFGRNNEGQQLRRELSRVLWQHFEPSSTWQPVPPEQDRFR